LSPTPGRNIEGGRPNRPTNSLFHAMSAFHAFFVERGLRLSASEEADAHLIHAEHLVFPRSALRPRDSCFHCWRRRAMSGKSALKLLNLSRRLRTGLVG
jgi:hypothetical protein